MLFPRCRRQSASQSDALTDVFADRRFNPRAICVSGAAFLEPLNAEHRMPMTQPPSDKELSHSADGAVGDGALIAAHNAGDPAAFAKIVRRYQSPVYRMALRWSRDPDEADEVVQKTFLRLLNHIGGFQGNQLKSYLFRITANLCKNHLRDRARLVLGLPRELVAMPNDGAVEYEEERAILRRLMGRLPRRQRQVVSLRIDGDLSFTEVASILGITENSAKVNFHHALKHLRLLMAQDEMQLTQKNGSDGQGGDGALVDSE